MIIDRFEGKFAVVELDNGSFENIPKALLPTGAKEGDCIIITIDENTTADKKEKIKNKMNKLFQD